jgi:transcriptional regulator with XRE-family HTH domain
LLIKYPGDKLKNLRKRSLLTLPEIIASTGITETTIYNIEHERVRPQAKTLRALLNLYFRQIQMVEKMETLWGPDGKQNIPITKLTNRERRKKGLAILSPHLPPSHLS